MNLSLQRIVPAWAWMRDYHRGLLAGDLVAALVVTMMLVPQALAYALLAGLPAHIGLYASILPLLVYALFSSSKTLSVGPVALTSLLTAAVVGKLAVVDSHAYISAAIVLAMLCGLILLLMGLFRFGFIANFLSHPVVSGFVTASAVLIALSQVGSLVGVATSGSSAHEILFSLLRHIDSTHILTLAVGCLVLAFLWWARSGMARRLIALGVAPAPAALISKAAPAMALILSTLVSYYWQLEFKGVAVVGDIPKGLPELGLPSLDPALWSELAVSALLIAIIGFVESVSLAKTLAAKRRQRIQPDRELVALGAANISSAVSGGFVVAGGFSRSVVNFEAGAQTQAAGMFAAVGLAVVALFFTPALYFLPKTTLAATIIIAVASLIDMAVIRRAWRYSTSDFIAIVVTIAATLLLGIEQGVLAGITLSIALHLYKTMQPHIAVVGEVPGTEHFRNVKRHQVVTHSNIVSLRIDESLYFANASYLEDRIYDLVSELDGLEHVILQCTAVNEIDLSALDALESINYRLKEQDITLNLSEVKGPVIDALRKSDFLDELSGKVFLTQHLAVQSLKHDEIEPYII
ncbi:MAG: sulfate permease [Pseudomonadota bacterium]